MACVFVTDTLAALTPACRFKGTLMVAVNLSEHFQASPDPEYPQLCICQADDLAWGSDPHFGTHFNSVEHLGLLLRVCAWGKLKASVTDVPLSYTIPFLPADVAQPPFAYSNCLILSIFIQVPCVVLTRVEQFELFPFSPMNFPPALKKPTASC